MTWSAKDLETIFGTAALTKTAIRAKFADVPFVGMCPKTQLETTIFSYDIEEPDREIDSNFVATDGSSQGIQRQTYGRVSGEMPVTFKNKTMPPELLNKLRNPGTRDVRNMETWITREVVNMKNRYGDYLDAYMIASMLTGSLTITVSGVSTSIDYGVPTSHKPTGGAWSNVATSIKGDVLTATRLVSDDTGYAARYAFVNATTMNYLFANTEIQNYIKETNQGQTVVEKGIITNLYGLTWVKVDQSYMSSGVATRFLANDKIIFTPEWSDEWIEMLVGRIAVLNDNGEETMADGLTAWSRPSEDPVGRKLYMKYARIPALKVPKCVVYMTVT